MPPEAYIMLKEMYGNEWLTCTQMSEWFKRFKGGRETSEDKLRSGRLSTAKPNGNLQIISEPNREDHRLGIRTVAELAEIDKENVRQILHESFNMRKVSAKIMLIFLKPKRK